MRRRSVGSFALLTRNNHGVVNDTILNILFRHNILDYVQRFCLILILVLIRYTVESEMSMLLTDNGILKGRGSFISLVI